MKVELDDILDIVTKLYDTDYCPDAYYAAIFDVEKTIKEKYGIFPYDMR